MAALCACSHGWASSHHLSPPHPSGSSCLRHSDPTSLAPVEEADWSHQGDPQDEPSGASPAGRDWSCRSFPSCGWEDTQNHSGASAPESACPCLCGEGRSGSERPRPASVPDQGYLLLFFVVAAGGIRDTDAGRITRNQNSFRESKSVQKIVGDRGGQGGGAQEGELGTTQGQRALFGSAKPPQPAPVPPPPHPQRD